MNTESVRKKITYHFYPRKYSMATTNKRIVSAMTTTPTHACIVLYTNIYAEVTVFDEFLHFLLEIHLTGN